MELSQVCLLISTVLYTVTSILYLISVHRATSHPNLMSFIIWTLANASLLVSLIVEDVWSSVPATVVGFLSCLAIVVVAWRKRSFYISSLDRVAFVIGLIGLIIWIVTKEASYNIYILALLNTVANIPIVVKLIKDPTLEARLPWAVHLTATVFLMLSITSWEPVHLATPLQILICSSALNLALLRGSMKKIGVKR